MKSISHTINVCIPFHDVDMMSIAWHGHYVKYFELARCTLLDCINYGYMEMKDSGYCWPIVDLNIKYIKPAEFGQRLLVTASVKEYENRLVLDYLVKDEKAGEKLTKGRTIQVAVEIASGELQLVSPAVLVRRIEAMA